jgi:hypothetical protein
MIPEVDYTGYSRLRDRLRPRDVAVLRVLVAGRELSSGRVWRLAFPDEPYRGRRDAGMTRTLDRLERLGLVAYRYVIGGQQPSRNWRITDAGREAVPMDTNNERRAIFVYEGARLQAIAVDAPVVPEPWDERDAAFQMQFLDVIAMMGGPNRKSSPEELHDDWVKAYEQMGWVYGPERDVRAKRHPDMVPFDQLEQREQDKDAVFIALCEIARQWIRDASA